MKKYSILLLIPLIALLLSSCSMHLGLGKLLKGGSPQAVKTKHIKATHTPPSPPTATPAGAELLTPTPLAGNQPAGPQANSGIVVLRTNTSYGIYAVSANRTSPVPSP